MRDVLVLIFDTTWGASSRTSYPATYRIPSLGKAMELATDWRLHRLWRQQRSGELPSKHTTASRKGHRRRGPVWQPLGLWAVASTGLRQPLFGASRGPTAISIPIRLHASLKANDVMESGRPSACSLTQGQGRRMGPTCFNINGNGLADSPTVRTTLVCSWLMALFLTTTTISIRIAGLSQSVLAVCV